MTSNQSNRATLALSLSEVWKSDVWPQRLKETPCKQVNNKHYKTLIKRGKQRPEIWTCKTDSSITQTPPPDWLDKQDKKEEGKEIETNEREGICVGKRLASRHFLLVDDGHTFCIDDGHHSYSLITITIIAFADFIALVLFFHPHTHYDITVYWFNLALYIKLQMGRLKFPWFHS